MYRVSSNSWACGERSEKNYIFFSGTFTTLGFCQSTRAIGFNYNIAFWLFQLGTGTAKVRCYDQHHHSTTINTTIKLLRLIPFLFCFICEYKILPIAPWPCGRLSL